MSTVYVSKHGQTIPYEICRTKLILFSVVKWADGFTPLYSVCLWWAVWWK